MGNRGKGAKGKSSKRGKKGKKGGGGNKASTKWGDEQAALAAADAAPPAKKKRRSTQETQDRERRMKLMELERAKERKKRERLSQPNHALLPDAVPAAVPKQPKKRKRRRPLRPTVANSRDGRRHYYSSSDDDADAGQSGGKSKGSDAGFDPELATYKKLLSALETGGVRVDTDLDAAVRARRMQRQGLDGGYLSEDSGDEEEEEEEEGGDDGDEDVMTSNGSSSIVANGAGHGRDEGQEEAENEEGAGASEEAESRAAAESGDLGADNEDDYGDPKNRASGRRSTDEFNRHFVSTPVFPPEEAVAMLSTSSGRPSFKPVGKTDGQRKWTAAGLSILASKKTAGEVAAGPAAASTPSSGTVSVSRDLGVLPSLVGGWEACDDASPSGKKLQSLLLPPMVGYRDMLYCGWRDEDAANIRRAYALHALNHALTSQRRVLRHNVKLRKAAEEVRMAETLARDNENKGKHSNGTAAGVVTNGTATPPSAAPAEGTKQNGKGAAAYTQGSKKVDIEKVVEKAPTVPAAAGNKIAIDADESEEDWQRDQGFTRPKVLILLPFRALAYELVETMVGLLGPKTVVINRDRFDEEYGPDDSEDDDLGLGGQGPKGDEQRVERARAVIERKPGDFKALMGEGRNVDDMFTIGLSISPGGGKGKPGEGKGVAVRLYCDFYNSDIILASPVAMHRAAVPTAEDGAGGNDDDVDADFLSSIEVCIMDRADVFLMQNWAYVPEIAEVLNARPKGERAARVDFSRVRHSFLHDQGRLFRQTLIFSAIQQDPNLNAFVSRHCRNYDGIVKICRPSGDGHICQVAVQAKQVFQRVPSDSPSTQDDARFDYFVGTVLPQILRARQAHTAVFIPSYFDYVRLRNHLLKNKASVVSVHEYSRGSEVKESR
ncbi:unnamed protein product, partial [Sphacelaria rigidula]